MISTAYASRISAELVERWWHNFTSAACSLPREHSREWIQLISQVVRYYRMLLNSSQTSSKRAYWSLCRSALAKSRWELMLLSIYGYISPAQMFNLDELQKTLERSLEI